MMMAAMSAAFCTSTVTNLVFRKFFLFQSRPRDEMAPIKKSPSIGVLTRVAMEIWQVKRSFWDRYSSDQRVAAASMKSAFEVDDFVAAFALTGGKVLRNLPIHCGP